MYCFGELNNNAAILLQRAGDTSYAININIWLNMAQMYAANKYDFWSELQRTYTFATVAAQETYYMPSDFDKPTRIYDLTNNLKPTMITREEYFDANIATISNAQTGVPQYSMFYGIGAINVNPTGPFTVEIKSSSLSDTNNAICRLEGWLDSAQTILGYTDITVSSSTPTTYTPDPNLVNFYGITRFTKSADTTGFISLATSTGTLIATIAPDDRQSRYPTLYLGLIPAAAYNYETLYKRKIKKMVNSNDYPFADMDDFIITYTTALGYSQEKETSERATQLFGVADKLLGEAIRNEMDKYGVNYQQKFINKTAQSHRC